MWGWVEGLKNSVCCGEGWGRVVGESNEGLWHLIIRKIIRNF